MFRYTIRRPLNTTRLATEGFEVTKLPLLSSLEISTVKDRFPKVFGGDFDTKQYPDEWHWRPGFSKEDVTREICNGWKCDKTLASVVLSPHIGRAVCKLMGWKGARVGQDDIIWKPKGLATTVGFHRDSEYINSNFHGDGCTLWVGLDGGSERNGGVCYAVGSQNWEIEGEMTFMQGGSDDPVRFLKDAKGDEDIELKTPECGVGHAILHHKDIWHGSGANKSTENDRMAIAIHFISEECTWKETQNGLPWGDGGYIYGRYKKMGSNLLAEEHFPVTWSERDEGRTKWIEELIGDTNAGKEWADSLE